MATSGTVLENEECLSWTDLCEKQAKSAASELADVFYSYVSAPLSTNPRTLSHKKFMSKFMDSFVLHFEVEVAKRNSLKDLSNKIPNGVPKSSSHEDFSDYFDQGNDTPSPKAHHRPFFRRLSFKGLKKGKGLFHKQHSDEAELSHQEKSREKSSKTKLAKIVVECRKEGIVNYLIGENKDGTHKWEKCRLALVKTVGGYMLEFYSPPKSVKPRSGVFCFLITEARETTALEMPDHENTFVLKAENHMEYVIEAHDTDDMRSWLATIKYCMRTALTINENSEIKSLLCTDERRTKINAIAVEVGEDNGTDSENQLAPPELPPRVPGPAGVRSSENSGQRLSNNSSTELCTSRSDVEAIIETELDLSAVLKEYPWFHGTLPRSDAAQLVLHEGTSGHGVFLVRQSETRKGEFVLTFNFQGRAKHLRMTLNDLGQCRVQHLWFPTIIDMLEHFRQHPIPLESGGTADVTLTQFVIAPSVTTPNNSSTRSSNNADRRLPPNPDPVEVITYSGSIRTRSDSMERLSEFRASGGEGSHAQSARAVENTYSFI
ncbi:hypothetical protein RUM43_011586 [Polyplax serrata]|uniref:Uncharacterized protein n=1 Tax=Polyplax serrata TaxID=468196 RepID=A0AAN8NMJ5_POLSC